LINIVHVARTPSAGSPIRLVKALKKFSDFNVSLIDLRKFDIYPQDIVFEEEVQHSIELFNKADIIHFHHYIDLDTNEFHPINFRKLKDNGTVFLRQYRTNPNFAARSAKVDIKKIYDNSIPTIVVGQYMERFYPEARVVPNIIPENDPLYVPNDGKSRGIFFAPTFKHSAWSERWETKAAPEVKNILNRIKSESGTEIISFNQKPLNETLKLKQSSKIVIDDLITGSYHISSLEGLSMGKPVLTYLDDRTRFVLNELSDSNNCPILNVKLEEVYDILHSLLNNEETINQIGEESRKWIKKYWSEEKLVNHYINVYKDLLENPNGLKRQESLKISNDKDYFFSIVQPDLIYENRNKLYLNKLSFLSLISIKTKKYYSCVKFELKMILIRLKVINKFH